MVIGYGPVQPPQPTPSMHRASATCVILLLSLYAANLTFFTTGARSKTTELFLLIELTKASPGM